MAELHDSMATLQQAILDSANFSIVSTSLDGTIQSFNAAAEKMLGYTAAEVMGKVTPAILHEPTEVAAQAQRLSAELQRTIEPGFEVFVAKAKLGQASEDQWTYIRKDGSRFPVLLSVTALYDRSEQIIGFLGIAKDITEQKQYEAEIHQIAQRLSLATASAQLGIWDFDVAKSQLVWDDRMYALYGIQADQFSGAYEAWQAGVHPDDQAASHGAVQAAIAGTKDFHTEFRVLWPNGETRYLEAHGIVQRAADGIPLHMIGVNQDITERKQTEKQLIDITAALDQTAIVAITDVQGTITFVNDKFCEISKYSREELIGQNHRILNSGHHSHQFFNELWQTIAQGKIWRAEIKNRAKDGSFYWVDTTIVPFLDSQGKPYQYLAIRKDITARKAGEVELQKLSMIASQTDNVAIVTDAQGRIEWVNESFSRVTGYTLPEVRGQKPGSFLQGPKTSQDTVAKIRYALASHEPFLGEILNYRKDGSAFWIQLQINPVFDDRGTLIQFISIESEITTRKEIETRLRKEVAGSVRELRSLARRLEISNRELQDFAYVASHDLQEPLRKIQAFGDRLKSTCQDSLSEKGLDYLERMLNASSRAQILINDLLAFSRVSTKAQPFEAADLAEILAGVLSDLEVRIEQEGATIEADDLPVIEAEPLQMRQLLQNLISNALKFRAEGIASVVQVRSRVYTDKGQDWCEIRVIDNGIGFEQKYADRIFQIFQRLHGRGSYEGTGVGLSICRKIAEHHGGTLTAVSQPNQGATMIFTLPVHQIRGASHDS